MTTHKDKRGAVDEIASLFEKEINRFMPPAITLTLYDKNDEPIKEFTRSIIPWGLIKKASRLMDEFSADESSEEEPAPKKRKWLSFLSSSDQTKSTEEKQMEAISDFVVELFGNQFTRQELEDGADLGDIMTVFQAVLTRANAAVQSNPTMIQSLQRKRKRK